MFLVSKIAAGGTVAIGFGGYYAQLFPGVSDKGAAATAVVVLTLANYFGVKKAGKLNLVIVTVTLATLVFFVTQAGSSFNPQNFVPFAPTGYGATLQSAAILFFAYTGYARIATLAEEVHEPEKTIPRAIVISLGTSAVLYFLVAFTAVGAIGATTLSQSQSPLVEVAKEIRSPSLALVIGIGATTAMLGVLLSQVLGISRVILAMSRRNDLPSPFEHVNKRYGVPDRAILFTGLCILLLAVFGTLQWVVTTATFTILLYYAITNIAALRMDRQDKKYPNVIAWLGLGSCLCLAAFLQAQTILAGLSLLAIGFIFRSIVRRFSNHPGAST